MFNKIQRAIDRSPGLQEVLFVVYIFAMVGVIRLGAFVFGAIA